MPKKRFTPALDVVFPPWLTALNTNKGEKGFIQIGWSLLESKDFQALTGEQRKIYLAMCAEAGGRPDFEFSLRHFTHYGIKRTKAYQNIQVLRDLGFITCPDEKSIGSTTRYRFSSDWKNGNAKRRAEAIKGARKKQ